MKAIIAAVVLVVGIACAPLPPEVRVVLWALVGVGLLGVLVDHVAQRMSRWS